MKETLEKLHALSMQMEDIISGAVGDDPEGVLDELKEKVEDLTFSIQEEIEAL